MKKNPSRVIKLIETKNCYSPLETDESPFSPNTEITAKQNTINTATQNLQNSNNRTESDTPEKRKFPVTVTLGDSMVMDIKG